MPATYQARDNVDLLRGDSRLTPHHRHVGEKRPSEGTAQQAIVDTPPDPHPGPGYLRAPINSRNAIASTKKSAIAETVISAAKPYLASKLRSLLNIRPLVTVATPPTNPPNAPPINTSKIGRPLHAYSYHCNESASFTVSSPILNVGTGS